MKRSASLNHSLKKAAVIGHPISHSKSPLIHNHWLQHYGLPVQYDAMDVSPDHLATVMDTIRGNEWVGINVTIPNKEAVLAYLDETDPMVHIIGACNTIVNDGGRLMGYNTDAPGFDYPIQDHAIQSALVLGNGGAAKAVLYQLCVRGVHRITLVARHHKKSQGICQALASQFGVEIHCQSFDECTTTDTHDLVVNTTSVGMSANDSPFPLIRTMSADQIYYDLIYQPWETAMMAIARQQSATVYNGAYMLAHQGALAFEYLFHQSVSTEGMHRLLVP